MFDMKPSTFAKISNTDTGFYIQYDTNLDDNALAESNYIAILNHNFQMLMLLLKFK